MNDCAPSTGRLRQVPACHRRPNSSIPRSPESRSNVYGTTSPALVSSRRHRPFLERYSVSTNARLTLLSAYVLDPGRKNKLIGFAPRFRRARPPAQLPTPSPPPQSHSLSD